MSLFTYSNSVETALKWYIHVLESVIKKTRYKNPISICIFYVKIYSLCQII